RDLQHVPGLCRQPRLRPEPEAAATHPRRRFDPRRRSAPRRSHDRRLYSDHPRAPRPDARPRPSRPQRARPRLSRGPADLRRHGRYGPMPTQLAPTSGTMGYGVPAAVAAALRFRDRPVVAVAGDGDFLMNGQELATAAQYGADLLVIVVDNASYGTIRMHQERDYPERVSATELNNPDFAALARAYGGWAAT